MKEYYIINRFNGGVIVVMSRNRHRAMNKGRRFFGQIALDLIRIV